MEGYQGFSAILLAGTGYNELHYCKVTSSVMCGAKYKSVPGWVWAAGLLGWVLARNLKLRDTLVPNVCRLCIWDDMECQLPTCGNRENFANNLKDLISLNCEDVWLNINTLRMFPHSGVLH